MSTVDKAGRGEATPGIKRGVGFTGLTVHAPLCATLKGHCLSCSTLLARDPCPVPLPPWASTFACSSAWNILPQIFLQLDLSHHLALGQLTPPQTVCPCLYFPKGLHPASTLTPAQPLALHGAYGSGWEESTSSQYCLLVCQYGLSLHLCRSPLITNQCNSLLVFHTLGCYC